MKLKLAVVELVVPEGPPDSWVFGALLSTRKVRAELVPVFPAASTCTACAVYVPSGRLLGTIDQAPPLRVAASDCSGEPEALAPA